MHRQPLLDERPPAAYAVSAPIHGLTSQEAHRPAVPTAPSRRSTEPSLAPNAACATVPSCWSVPKICALSPRDLRARLDQMILGPHADEGLDALLGASVLDFLFPEVKSMVGFGDGDGVTRTSGSTRSRS